jgi:hypothetical protein
MGKRHEQTRIARCVHGPATAATTIRLADAAEEPTARRDRRSLVTRRARAIVLGAAAQLLAILIRTSKRWTDASGAASARLPSNAFSLGREAVLLPRRLYLIFSDIPSNRRVRILEDDIILASCTRRPTTPMAARSIARAG